LLLIQGLGAATLDNPRPDEPIDKPQGMGVYRTLADAAARAGMVVVRVDKGGCGDSEGDPARLDFEQELDGYRSALAALKARPDVDGDRVFAFGHSMGGIFAPILATETPLRGVVVYGTVLKTWLEYLAENTRRQVMLAGADPVAFDRMVRGIERFHHAMIVDGKAPSAIFAAEPELAPLKGDLAVEGDTMFGRNYTFFQQLSARNMAEFWTKAAPRTQVLALWGEAEYVSTREDHEWIAALVDRVAPGHGAFAVVTDSEHGFGRADTAADAMKLMHTPGATPEFNPEIVKVLLGWLKEKSAEGS
jgi:alpha-beta hydrolase superfamily lysophospholipase